MDRAQKAEQVASLRQTFDQATIVVLTRNKGLTAAEAARLRQRMRQAGARFRVAKNRLARIALKGTPYEALDELFTGPTGIAFSDDPVAAAKASVEFLKESEHLEILGGAMKALRMTAEDVKTLASLPPLDQLRARLLGVINAPAQRLAMLLKEPGRRIAHLAGAYGAKAESA